MEEIEKPREEEGIKHEAQLRESVSSEKAEKTTKKPFNLVEELKKPFIVGIKPEYVVMNESLKRPDSIVSEHEQGVTYKTKRSRTDVGIMKRDECDGLCRHIALGEACPLGDKCKYDHDIAAFFARRPADIGTICPVWERHGYCPAGLNCRWAGSHTNLSDYSSITREITKIEELNGPRDLITALRKKKYVFEIKDEAKSDTKSDTGDVVALEEKAPIGGLGEEEKKHVDFKRKLYIAPLTTVGNLPFRRICVDFGAEITCSEMVMTSNILRGQGSEWALLRRHPCEKVFGIQMASGRVEEVGAVSELLSREMQIDFIDLNAGCPIEILDKIGGGASLLARPGRLKRMVECMLTHTGNTKVECVVKVRTGDRTNNLHSFLPQLQLLRGKNGKGLSSIIIHGRTKQARYTKTADWSYIRECGESQDASCSRMNVIGNGDVFSYETYYDHLANDGVDGVMIGRGALIKPWICTEIKERRNWDISASERLGIIKTYCDYGLEHWGSDEQGVARTRRFLLEWMSFLCRYVPIGLLDRPQTIQQKPMRYVGRSDLETLLGSTDPDDWVKISSMFLGPAPESFHFLPKHKSNAYIECVLC